MYSPGRFNRRDFVRTALGAAGSLLLPGDLAQGMSRQARDRILEPYNARKGIWYEGLVATRCGTFNLGSGDPKFMGRTGHVAVVDIKKLKIACANYFIGINDANEINGGSTQTVSASVEYPASSGNLYQLLFKGSTTGTIAPGGIIFSDYVTLPIIIPAGQVFQIRMFYSGSVVYAGACTFRDVAKGDMFNYNSAPSDQTMGGTLTNSGTLCAPPAAIIGMTNKPSVIALGDSITFGGLDTSTISDQRMGCICKGFPADTLAFLNHGTGAATAWASSAQMVTVCTSRKQLWPYATHFIDALGHNDIFNDGHSAAQTETDLRNLVWSKLPQGAIIIRETLIPMSSSAGALWETDGDQTANAQTSIRNTFNANVRAGMTGVFTYFETSDTVESVRDNGKWKGDGVTPKLNTTDGIHGNAAGYTLMAAAIDMSKIQWG